jgi:hypothetical protein
MVTGRGRALSTVAALALGLGGLLAPASASAAPGGPADCDAYTYFGAGSGYATITCYAPSANYVGHVVCRMWQSPWSQYTITGPVMPKYATSTLYCHFQDSAISAGGVQA